MLASSRSTLTTQIEERLFLRNQIMEEYFAHDAKRIAAASREMSERFLKGGRLLAFGRGPCATDAQHVSVEFVHPVIVGRRALPALDLSLSFRLWMETILESQDIVMGFAPPEGDLQVNSALEVARIRGAMTFALPGHQGAFALTPPTNDPFIHQELVEVLYHTLWETVHVFFERREPGHEVGESEFLSPFLGKQKQETKDVLAQVAASILMKVRDDSELRVRVARESSERIGNAARAIDERLKRGGKLIVFGNGGSATDANDLALDCVQPPPGYRPLPAISLAMEPANITAVANDVGSDVIFLRQLIALARTGDVAVAISTSGGSRNIVMALEEARRRNMLTVALLGHDGGEVMRRGLADFSIVVHCDYIPRIQEVQASVCHVLREMLEVISHGLA